MEVVVRGRNLRIPTALRTLATEKVQKIERFTHDASRVEVDFEEVKSHRSAGFVCDITAHLKRHFVKASANASEPAAALDLALDKAQHQVARIKEKRVSRSHPRRRNHDHASGDGSAEGDDGGELDESDTGGASGDGAPIVKTKRFTMKPMGLEEAALQMELLGHDFFLFTNAENGHAAVLYRRRDGALGLIETTG
jgi:putative sigma-54 modulation protein